MRPKRVLALLLLMALAGGAYWFLVLQIPPGPRSARAFDPDRLAQQEVDMWRAYYNRENVNLFRTLVTALREQFNYPWSKAGKAGYHLARAASAFGRSTGPYEHVLPDLEKAYVISRDWTGAGYDPAQVARAELAWWVARREPTQRDPANVGRLITVLYSRFYEIPEDQVREAGLLRAQAANLRDRGGLNPDWPEIGRLLQRSYRSLHAAFEGKAPTVPAPAAAPPPRRRVPAPHRGGRPTLILAAHFTTTEPSGTRLFPSLSPEVILMPGRFPPGHIPTNSV